MSAIQGYLEKLGGNFLVASFIPSLTFVISSIVIFGPIIPESVLKRIQFLLSPFGQFGLLIILIAVIIGFTLTSLNTQVYKIFEGYVLTKYLSFFLNLERKRARELRQERERIIRKINRLQNKLDIWEKSGLPSRPQKEKAKIETRIESLRTKRDDVTVTYDQRYPPYESMILPTRLGNILRAAEIYPRTRWGIDPVPIWPRLIYAASTAEKGESYLTKVDFSNDQCSFLLNSSLLSGVFAVIALVASIYQYFLLALKNLGYPKFLYFIPIDSQTEVYIQRAIIYLVVTLLSLIVAWYFYNASLWNVSQYGNLIRSTFDLFRFNLLESLHLPFPQDNSDDDEVLLWRKVSELITVGKINTPIYLEYSHPKKSTD
jgi:hypothetical protein